MFKRSVEWLHDRIESGKVGNVTVVGHLGQFLIEQGRADLLPQAGTLRGDGLIAFTDCFRFTSYSFQGLLIYPLRSVEAVFCEYICRYDTIHAVYADGGNQPVVVLKDVLSDDEDSEVLEDED